MVSGAAGGTGVTTYAENIGVMAATKIYSTAMFVVAALIALVLGFSPKFGALVQAIPLAVMGGVSIVVFGLIAMAGAKIWVDNKVDFSQNKNLIVAAITLILGTGDFTLKFGQSRSAASAPRPSARSCSTRCWGVATPHDEIRAGRRCNIMQKAAGTGRDVGASTPLWTRGAVRLQRFSHLRFTWPMHPPRAPERFSNSRARRCR